VGGATNTSLERMFAHPKNRVDIFKAMNEGSLILIHTAKDFLKQDGCELFGRFMIALISQATQERAAIAKEERKPTFVYIDEVQDYLDDEGVGIEQLLNQGRKYNVGLTLAHQNLGQLSRKIQASVMSSTATKIIGGLSAADLEVFAREFAAPVDELREVMKKTATQATFFVYSKNQTQPEGVTQVPFGLVERLPKMSDAHYQVLLNNNRLFYGAKATDKGGKVASPIQIAARTGFELEVPGKM
jgi:hypothetical protein